MDKRDEIKCMMNGMKDYLQSIDLTELKKLYSKEELAALHTELKGIAQRDLVGELEKIIHFESLGDIFTEIDCLNYYEKKGLYQYLKEAEIGHVLKKMEDVIRDDVKRAAASKVLTEKGILERVCTIRCPYCGKGNVSDYITLEKAKECNELIGAYKVASSEGIARELRDEFDRIVELSCNECDYDTQIDKVKSISVNVHYALKRK